MTAAAVTLVISAFVSGAVTVIVVLIVAAIHAGDRYHQLTAAPRSRLEALSRAILGVGIRSSHPDGDED